jgi:hypothetical protein
MSASLNVRRSVIVIAVVAALVAIPAIASAATGTTTRASLTGMGGYCHDGGTAGALGKVQIVTPTATDAGFHPVHVDIRVAPGKLTPGAYQVARQSLPGRCRAGHRLLRLAVRQRADGQAWPRRPPRRPSRG